MFAKLLSNRKNLVYAAAVVIAAIAGGVWEFGGALLPAKTVEAAAASKGSDETQKVSLTVGSVKTFDANGQGTVAALVNDTQDFRQAHMTVVILKGSNCPVPAVGSHITVTGKVTDYKGKPEIKVSSASQISSN